MTAKKRKNKLSYRTKQRNILNNEDHILSWTEINLLISNGCINIIAMHSCIYARPYYLKEFLTK